MLSSVSKKFHNVSNTFQGILNSKRNLDKLFVNKKRKVEELSLDTKENHANYRVYIESKAKRVSRYWKGNWTKLVLERVDGSKESWRWGKALSGLPSCCAVVTCVTQSRRSRVKQLMPEVLVISCFIPRLISHTARIRRSGRRLFFFSLR